MISAVGVVVPARDERATIRECVRGVLAALRELPAHVDTAVCVVADRCVDDTAALAAAELTGWHGARVVVNRQDRTIGEVRDTGLRYVMAALATHRPSGVWLLSTDADTTVTRDWAVQHVRAAEHGAHAVAGAADLAGPCPLRYPALLAGTRRPDGHGNVYGANLGVRADAYRAVGGFGAVRSGEDHDLWRRLGAASYRCRYADEPKVLTSARRHGRAPGGLADLLCSLDVAS